MAELAIKLNHNSQGRFRNTLQRMRKFWYCYVFLLGTMSLLLTFSYIPALSAFYHSFTVWDGYRPGEWVGLKNYEEIFTSRIIFRKAFLNMLLLTVWTVFRAAVFPLIGAALVYRLRNEKLAYAFRLVFVLPLVAPIVVIILTWRWFYEPNIGLFNEILALFGLKGLLWLNGTKTALFSLMFMGFPWIDGIGLLIYLAGLLGIPNEVVDAAIVDGASSVKRFFSIELPLLVPQVRLIVILNIIGSLQNFAWQLLVTAGGPANATTVPAWEMYEAAMNSSRYGIASAIGVILFVIIFAFTMINNALIRSSVEYSPDS